MFERFEAAGVAGLQGGYCGREGESFGMEGGPEEAREDLGVKVGRGVGLRVLVELLVVADGGIDASRVEHVPEHDFAGLERAFAETKFEEFEDSDLVGRVVSLYRFARSVEYTSFSNSNSFFSKRSPIRFWNSFTKTSFVSNRLIKVPITSEVLDFLYSLKKSARAGRSLRKGIVRTGPGVNGVRHPRHVIPIKLFIIVLALDLRNLVQLCRKLDQHICGTTFVDISVR